MFQLCAKDWQIILVKLVECKVDYAVAIRASVFINARVSQILIKFNLKLRAHRNGGSRTVFGSTSFVTALSSIVAVCTHYQWLIFTPAHIWQILNPLKLQHSHDVLPQTSQMASRHVIFSKKYSTCIHWLCMASGDCRLNAGSHMHTTQRLKCISVWN